MEEDFSKKESLRLIEQMISAAKNDHRENGEGWLWWGWMLFGASLLSALLVQINQGRYVGWVWSGMTLVVIVAFVWESRTNKIRAVKTYIEELLEKFSTGFMISLLTIIAANTIVTNYNDNDNRGESIAFAFGYFYILYAFWMYIHGSAIRFKTLKVGAFVNWADAIAIFIIKDFKYAMLISAFAVAVGFLIPGYMLRNQYKKSLKS